MSGRNSFPFTASQWQELEHQALIFKYMVSGVPIPSDLLFTLKRSLDSSNLILHQPQHIGWNCFQMGFGRKIDPEPGRCRRTDGKKWRCSKEAYPDSKYCERHMHRGRNRSRKPVEILTSSTTTIPTPTPTPTIPISSISKNTTTFTQSDTTSLSLSSLSSIPSDTHHYHHHHQHQHLSCYNTHPHHPFFYPPSKPPGIGFSSQDNTTHHCLLDSAPYSHTDKDYRNRYYGGIKEEIDEHALLFSGTPGTMRSYASPSMDDSLKLTPLAMDTTTHLKQRTCSDFRSGHSYLQIQGLTDASKQQQFYASDSDVKKCEMPVQIERETEPHKVMHHFFDEWPPKNKGSWLDSDDKLSKPSQVSTTQLSISIPNSSHDFFITSNDK
ncbi:growth-regulating factor 1-like isoform X2 [Cornus florida]|uniref:growth-regulating factor 1-like isoform X2 n=1 Tax=Cornus florida TaxID=4283 RepID=UPI00289FBCE1|nr:growth-regulating factor 1-like isoform X2 [Cornus florida]